MSNKPFSAYLRAYELAAPVIWLSSMPFLVSGSRAYAVAAAVCPLSVSTNVAVASMYTL
jgi:hypothetical protein